MPYTRLPRPAGRSQRLYRSRCLSRRAYGAHPRQWRTKGLSLPCCAKAHAMEAQDRLFQKASVVPSPRRCAMPRATKCRQAPVDRGALRRCSRQMRPGLTNRRVAGVPMTASPGRRCRRRRTFLVYNRHCQPESTPEVVGKRFRACIVTTIYEDFAQTRSTR